jgi:hypothetical protein
MAQEFDADRLELKGDATSQSVVLEESFLVLRGVAEKAVTTPSAGPTLLPFGRPFLFQSSLMSQIESLTQTTPRSKPATARPVALRARQSAYAKIFEDHDDASRPRARAAQPTGCDADHGRKKLGIVK